MILFKLFKKWLLLPIMLFVSCHLPPIIGNDTGQSVLADVIDTKSPIVIQYGDGNNQAKSVHGADDAYFGYSMAFMKDSSRQSSSVIFENSGRSEYGTLFIGAPRERRLSNNFGTIWSCKFSKNAKVSCSLLTAVSEQSTDTSDQSDRRCKQQLQYTRFNESESEQWIGASISANSQQLFACAPRWKQNGFSSRSRQNCIADTAMVGACYMIRNGRNSPEVQLVHPLYDKSKFYYIASTFKGEEVSQYLYLYAQFGMSSHVTLSEEFIIGAPNVRQWAGSYLDYTEEANQFNIINSNREINEIEENSLFGYTLTSGRAHGSGSYSYYVAVSAPRADDLLGMVVISQPRDPRPLSRIKGEQFGSYFGYALATADLNGLHNDNDELLVGAPLYTSDSKTASTGCVIIYSVNSRLTAQPIRRLCANLQVGFIRVTRGARFGSAIVNLGDLNFDKSEDFAVAAPYDDDGIGTVFIFSGGYPLSDKPAKVIRGKDLEIPGLNGFGTQLLSSSSNLDSDGNTTPDLAIGAWESQHVVILRTRPVAKPSFKVTFHTANSNGDREQIYLLLPTQDKFRVRICVYFTFPETFSAVLPKDARLETWLKLVGDSKNKRFEFDGKETRHSLSATSDSCVDKVVTVVEATENVDNADQVSFYATLWYNNTVTPTASIKSVRHATLQITPQPNNRGQSFTQDSSFENAHHTFDPYIPAPIPHTSSENAWLNIAKDDCNQDGNPQCNPELVIEQRIEIEDINRQRQEFPSSIKNFVGQIKSVYVTLKLTNKGETATRPTVKVSFLISDDFEVNANSIRFEWEHRRYGSCTSRNSRVNEKSPTTRLLCSKSLQNGQPYEYKLRIDIDSTKAIKVKDKLEGYITMITEAFPASQPDEKTQVTKSDSLYAKLEVEVDDEPPPGQIQIDPKKSGVDLTQIFSLKNTGFAPTSAEKVKVEIWIPAYVDISGNITQILEIANPSTSALRCVAENFDFYIPPQQSRIRPGQGIADTSFGTDNGNGESHSRSRSPSSLRTKRSTPHSGISPENITLQMSDDNMIVLSGCKALFSGASSASCHLLTCYTDLLAKETRVIQLRMYVLQNALEELLTEETTGIRVESVLLATFPGNQTEKIRSTQRTFARRKPVPAYYYLLAGGVGTILVILVAFCLYKCGFFRRKTKEQLKVLKRQTMAMDQLGALDMSVIDNSYDEGLEETQ